MRIRVLLLVTVLLLATVSATLAQPKYKLRMHTKIGCAYNSYRNGCSGNLYTATANFIYPTASRPAAQQDDLGNGNVGYNQMWKPLDCNAQPYEYWDSITWNVSQELTKIVLYSSSDEYSGNNCHVSCQKSKDWIFGDWYTSNGFFYSYWDQPSDCYASMAEVWIFPERVDLWPDDPNETYLPTTDRVTIHATEGYPAPVYKWEYNAGAGWKDFPAAYGKSTISVCGRDLMGTDFDNIPSDQNVVFRIHPVDYFESQRLTLTPSIPSPHITSVTPVPNKCFGAKDGTFIVQFDRPLHAGETLNITMFNNTEQHSTTSPDPTALSSDNTYTFPAQFGPGNYTVTLFGSYRNVNTYTRDPQHTTTTGFAGPAAVSFTNSVKNVNCFNGADGTIILNATGGVGNYSAGYKQVQDDTYNWTGFGSPGQHIISGLDSGVYQLRIYDGNNCVMKDGAGNEVIQTRTITQPATPVQVDYRQAFDPTAFGYTDGKAMAIIIGGSPVNGNSYNVVWKDSASGSLFTTVINSTNPFTSTLQQIGDGAYIVTASDANYAGASGANAAGCMVSDTIRLHEPPELIVTVEEHHYVSCKNGSDGELYAKAQGGIEIPSKRYTYQWFRNDNSNWTSIGQTDSFAVKLTAGTYKIKITDKNNVSKESAPFVLSEPNLLTVALSSTQVFCSGGNNGTASAVITGGTQPYAIEWSNGATSTAVTGLQDGNYLAFVSDVRGCQTQQQVKVTAPNPIVINSPVVQQPVCVGYCNGAISYTVSGGLAPYSYQWSNGGTGQTLSALCAGAYTVKITDAQGCWKQETFNLQNPLPISVDLGADRTLCTGQSWLANAAITDAQAMYSWIGPNGFSANTASVSLTNPGKYKVLVTDSKGCFGSDSIGITRTDATVAAEFVSSTQAFKGDKVTFVNISAPWPETVEWLLPAGNVVTVVRRTDSLVELQFNATGTYRVGMRTGVGPCSKEYYNNISIIEGQSFSDPGTATDPFVLEFTVAPNPSKGQFTVTVGLGAVSDISLKLINLQTGAVIDQKRQTGGSKYTVPYNVNLVSGVYALVLETAKDYRIFRVLIL